MEKYHVDTTKPQVAIIVETSEPGRQYNTEKWIETAQEIVKYHPEAEFNIIFDPKKRPDDETFVDRDFIRESFAIALPNNASRMVGEPLFDIVAFMKTQNVVLANDTGLPHMIATASDMDMPNVVTLFAAPHANPDFWVSSPRMKPLAPPENTPKDKRDGIYSTDTNIKWIDQIDPRTVAGQAMATWKYRRTNAPETKAA